MQLVVMSNICFYSGEGGRVTNVDGYPTFVFL